MKKLFYFLFIIVFFYTKYVDFKQYPYNIFFICIKQTKIENNKQEHKQIILERDFFMSKKNKRFILALICIVALSSVCLAAGGPLLSPALEHIGKQIEMKKCGIINSNVSFSTSDFDEILCTKAQFIKIESLPDAASGTLSVRNVPVSVNQIIARDDFKNIVFTPATDALTTATFTFSNATYGESEVSASCTVCLLDEINLAPQAGYQSINTLQNVAAFKFLKAADPENDALTYEIVSYPKRGTVTVYENADGYFSYTPKNNFTGKDSFQYVVTDVYGNKSEVSTVEISVSKPENNIYFDDLENHWAHNSAINIAAMGLMKGTLSDDGKLNFEPDKSVSRGDFLAMALISAGKEKDISFVDKTTFADDELIPINIKSYVQYAYDNGIISGYTGENGLAVFNSSSPITRAEAAVIVNNILSFPGFDLEYDTFTDSEDIPTWATSAISVLSSYGIFNGTGFGAVQPESFVSRAQTAEILCNINSVNKN